MRELVQMKLMGPEDVDPLRQAAKEDDHAVIAGTHMFVKNGKIVGYASVGVMPTVTSWFHTKEVGPLDSVYLFGQIEGILRERYQRGGCGLIAVPISPSSPFLKAAKIVGLNRIEDTILHLKGL